MIDLYIVRHGETNENARGILQGHLQSHLNTKGREQAKALQIKLAQLIQPDRIIASDLARTMETAEILNGAFHLPLEATPLLRERDWGELTGKQITSLHGKDFPPSVESLSHMRDRARQFLQQLASSIRVHPEIHSVLVVSHGVFSRCLQAVALNKSIHDIPLMANLEMRKTTLPSNFDQLPHFTNDSYEIQDDTSSLRHGKES